MGLGTLRGVGSGEQAEELVGPTGQPDSWWGSAGVPESRGSQERDSEGAQDGERKLGREKKGEKGAS